MVKAKIKQITDIKATRYEGKTIKYKSKDEKNIPLQSVCFLFLF
jgi:hypothetical protein